MGKWKSGIDVIFEGELIHFALYEVDDPTDQIDQLRGELRTDEEFGLMDVVDQLSFVVMSEDRFEEALKEYRIIKEYNDAKELSFKEYLNKQSC